MKVPPSLYTRTTQIQDSYDQQDDTIIHPSIAGFPSHNRKVLKPHFVFLNFRFFFGAKRCEISAGKKGCLQLYSMKQKHEKFRVPIDCLVGQKNETMSQYVVFIKGKLYFLRNLLLQYIDRKGTPVCLSDFWHCSKTQRIYLSDQQGSK